jgi:peptidoglycan/xylan/chitin deacetylase (PgdA/CDA1 family)
MRFLNRTLGPLFFPSILWRSKDQSIHLTFDDGPHPAATPRVLELLQKFGIRATFFLVGDRVALYPQIAPLILTSGHTIGCHSLSHRSLFLRSLSVQRAEIMKGKAAIETNTGKTPALFRPPYGHFDLSTLRASREGGMRVVLWDVDSQDFGTESDADVLKRLTKETRRGSVILLHDNDLTAKRGTDYLSAMVDTFLERGFTFSPVPE